MGVSVINPFEVVPRSTRMDTPPAIRAHPLAAALPAAAEVQLGREAQDSVWQLT